MKTNRINKHHVRYFHLRYTLEALKKEDGKILDVGCGRGELTSEIKKARPDLEFNACDINASYLNYFEKHLRKGKIIITKCDAHNLPYESASFKAVLMFDVLEHLENPTKALSEVSRVLKRTRTFHLVVPCEAGLRTLDGWLKKVFGKNLKREPIGHIQQFTLDEVKYILEKSGFKIQKVRFSYHFLYQFFSVLYFSYVTVFRKGKYLPLGNNPRRTFLSKILLWCKALGVWLTNSESYLLHKVVGQTAHITSIRK